MMYSIGYKIGQGLAILHFNRYMILGAVIYLTFGVLIVVGLRKAIAFLKSQRQH